MRFHLQERFIDFQNDDETRAILPGWSDFWIKCSERFPKDWGRVNLLLILDFPTTYVAQQGFNHVLRIRNKNRNRLDMNKTAGTP